MRSIPHLLYITSRRVRIAVGRKSAGGFLVYAGSKASAQTAPSFPQTFARLRDALLTAKVVVPSSDGEMAFVQDFIFSSSSAAASVVLGKSANGNDEWKPMA